MCVLFINISYIVSANIVNILYIFLKEVKLKPNRGMDFPNNNYLKGFSWVCGFLFESFIFQMSKDFIHR